MVIQISWSKKPRIAAVAVLTLSQGMLWSVRPAGAQEMSVDLEAFVTRRYVHGVPYLQARSYGRQAIPRLAAMLEDPTVEEHWATIVSTMGFIGDSSAVGPLMSFLKRQSGEISADAFRAVLGVLPALGNIAHDGDELALRILADVIQPDYWLKAGLELGHGRYRAGALGEVLGRVAILGLGVTGTAEALSILQGLSQDRGLRPDWRDNVDEAIDLNIRIHREGAERVLGGEVQ